MFSFRARFIAIFAFVSFFPFSLSVAQSDPKPACVPVPEGLVGWWRGESATSDQVGDYDGEVRGNLTYREGKVGWAFYYSNIIGYAKIPPLTELQGADGLTLECWIQPSTETEYPIIDWHDAAGHLGVHWWVFGGKGRLFLNFIDTQHRDHMIASGLGIIKTGVFQHIAATYDKESGIARLYRDGTLMAEDNLGKFDLQTSYPIYFGHRPDEERRFMGLMDEISIYNRALTPEEIQSIYRSGSAGKCLPNAQTAP